MIRNILGVILLTTLFFSCTTEGVKKDKTQEDEIQQLKSKNTGTTAVQQLVPGKALTAEEDRSGIKITWFEQGKGDLLKDGEVVKINYDVRLEDGTLVDGNQLLKRDWLPFLTGFGMQTSGWDIAFRKLRVGDFVEIVLPSEFARGKAGVKGLIPPDAVNILHVRILEKMVPTRNIDGTKVWLLEENAGETKKADMESEVEFHYMVGTPSNPKYDVSYRRNQPFLMNFSDNGVIKGLKKSLIGAKRADKLWVLVSASEAYGNQGLVELVKPGESVFYDIFIMNVR